MVSRLAMKLKVQFRASLGVSPPGFDPIAVGIPGLDTLFVR